MKGVILAAGMASRLRPLTDNCPKCLLKVGSATLLERTINNLAANGIRDIVIVTGYLADRIRDFVASRYEGSGRTFKFIHNERYDSTNNIYSLWLAMNHTGHAPLMLLDSDILFDNRIIGRLLNCGHPDALAMNRHELGDEEIKIMTDEQGRVTELNKECDPKAALGESVGIEMMSETYVRALKRELDEMIERERLVNVFYEKAFERLIPQGHSFVAVDTTDLFSIELDTVADFEDAKRLIPADLY